MTERPAPGLQHGRPPGMPSLDDPVGLRVADRELLSLALMDARNHLLARLALDESPAALRLALQAAWYQEHWIGTHPQRGRGEACDPHGPRLAGVEPALGAWLRGEAPLPTPERVRELLAQTLDVTLELLAMADGDDDALHFYRQALQHEDRLCEALDEALQTALPGALAVREALWMPARRWLLGSVPGGLVPVPERWAHEVAVPEFEIDAQPVTWAQFVEFAEDAGYDRQELWSPDGWAWVQAQGRRAPGAVEQLRGGALVQRGTGARQRLQRAGATQPVLHVSRHEAEAWCRWAHRRLPTEPEWEMAAATATSRGFAWGDVFEWVAGSARAWPGAPQGPLPGALDTVPQPRAGVLRGGSFATRARWRHPKARRFAAPEADALFCGFRSCAL